VFLNAEIFPANPETNCYRACVYLTAAAREKAVHSDRRNKLLAFLGLVLVGGLSAGALIAMHRFSDWLRVIAIITVPVVGGGVALWKWVLCIGQGASENGKEGPGKRTEKEQREEVIRRARVTAWCSVPLLLGFAAVVLLTRPTFSSARKVSIGAAGYITPSDNTNLAANGTATFQAQVPAHRKLLTIAFSVTQAPRNFDNCINGASLAIEQIYGGTSTQISINGRLWHTYQVPIPPGVREFDLRVTFQPQPGFSHCAENINVASAHFH